MGQDNPHLMALQWIQKLQLHFSVVTLLESYQNRGLIQSMNVVYVKQAGHQEGRDMQSEELEFYTVRRTAYTLVVYYIAFKH